MCVCVCVCVCVFMCACVYVCVQDPKRASRPFDKKRAGFVYKKIKKIRSAQGSCKEYVCMYVCIHMHVYLYIYVHMYIL